VLGLIHIKFFVQNRELYLLFFDLSQGAVHSFQRLPLLVSEVFKALYSTFLSIFSLVFKFPYIVLYPFKTLGIFTVATPSPIRFSLESLV
jgi:hypothetical protein